MEKYIQPFIDTTRNVFKEFVGTDLVVDRPFFADKDKATDWDISAVIGLTGEARGAVVISMKNSLAIRITDLLTGSSHTKLDDDVVDAAGEIVNIIAGNVKKNLEEAFRLVISLPAIVTGKEHTVKWPNNSARIICIPFTAFGNESFTLSVAIEAVKGA
ncbi:MAG: chemotaxis protein CheX [Treponema sp.]|jgi:chemotaxis protein CheX|nr:chemotaxis protein CheX [Treponema sp.]